MNTPQLDTQASSAERARVRSRCARIKELGFAASRHIKMYGERFEIVSDPYSEGDYINVRAISENDPQIRILLLPIAILLGVADRFLSKAKVTVQ